LVIYLGEIMGLLIRRSSFLHTDIKLDSIDISKLKKELEDYGYLSEIDAFETESELYELLQEDMYARSLVFQVLVNSNGYAEIHEWFDENKNFSVEFLTK
jgi:hypothetical protein